MKPAKRAGKCNWGRAPINPRLVKRAGKVIVNRKGGKRFTERKHGEKGGEFACLILRQGVRGSELGRCESQAWKSRETHAMFFSLYTPSREPQSPYLF